MVLFGKAWGMVSGDLCAFLVRTWQREDVKSISEIVSCILLKYFCFNSARFSKIVVLDLQTAFFDEKTVFFRFLAEIRLRTLIRSPQKASSTHFVQIPYHLHPARQGAHPALSNSLFHI